MGAVRQHHKTGPQAPIFRAALQPVELPPVSPLCICAAYRDSFEVVVRRLVLEWPALHLIFEHLPLEDQGWDIATTSIERSGTSTDKWPIWRVSRSSL